MIGVAFLALDVFFLTMSSFGWVRYRWLDFTDGAYWLLDVFFNFRVGVICHNKVNMRACSVAKSYAKSWLAFDLALVVYQWVMLSLETGMTVLTNAGSLRYTRFTRFLKLLRLTKLQMIIAQVTQRFNNIYMLLMLRLALYMVGILFYVHCSGSIWHSIGQSEESGWVFQYGGIFQPWPHNYIASVFWAVTQLQGSAEVMPGNFEERKFALVHYLLSVIVLALFVSRLTTVMQDMQDVGSDKRQTRNTAYMFMKKHKIPVELCIKLQLFLMSMDKISDPQTHAREMSLMSQLQPSLRRALLREVRMPVVCHNLLIMSFERSCAPFTDKILCDLLQPAFYSPEDRVFQHGVVCSRVYFLACGGARYLPYTQVFKNAIVSLRSKPPATLDRYYQHYRRNNLACFKDVGTTWCECALFVHWVTIGELDADSHVACNLLMLDTKAFEDSVMTYTAVQVSVLEYVRLVIPSLDREANITDLLSSKTITPKNRKLHR